MIATYLLTIASLWGMGKPAPRMHLMTTRPGQPAVRFAGLMVALSQEQLLDNPLGAMACSQQPLAQYLFLHLDSFIILAGYVPINKDLYFGAGGMAQQLRAPVFLKRTQVQFPVWTWWLTSIHNSSSRVSSALF